MIDFSAIYPPASLLRVWGCESTKTADPSSYIRRRIAEWCAKEGARLMLAQQINPVSGDAFRFGLPLPSPPLWVAMAVAYNKAKSHPWAAEVTAVRDWLPKTLPDELVEPWEGLSPLVISRLTLEWLRGLLNDQALLAQRKPVQASAEEEAC